MMRVADYIAQYLEDRGVRKVFLLAGGGMMHLIDAVGRRKTLDYVCNHHEHACALGAEGYARQTGDLGVCYATSGPGATNTVTGVVECWQDSVPVLFISGQAKLSQTIQGSKLFGLRQFGTFEADIISIVKPVTKYAAFIDDPKRIRYHLEKACALATSGRPGPVFLDVPVDIQGAQIDPGSLEGFDESAETVPIPSEIQIEDLVQRIAAAKRPLFLAGHGVRVAGAAAAFAEVLGLSNVPVATTQLAADLLPYDHPLYVGHPGMKGDRAGNLAVQTADVIVAVGTSLHVLTTGYELDRFAPRAYKVLVELDEHVLKRQQVRIDERIQTGVVEFLAAFDAALRRRGRPLAPNGAWHERCRTWKQDLAVRNEPHARNADMPNYYDLNDALSEACAPGDTIVTDAGSAFYVIGQAFRTKTGQRVISSGAMGAMGHALPVAIGACAAAPATRVVCVTGDGSLQTNLQELATLAHHGWNLKLFVVNNEGYVSIRNTQKNFFGGFFVGTSASSGVSLPSLEKLAAAYGLPYIRLADLASLHPGVRDALAAKGPAIVEVFTGATQEIIPTVSSYKRADGTMESKPLHDMYPFMEPETLKRYMQVE